MVALTVFEAFGLDATKESAGTWSDLLVLFAMYVPDPRMKCRRSILIHLSGKD